VEKTIELISIKFEPFELFKSIEQFELFDRLEPYVSV